MKQIDYRQLIIDQSKDLIWIVDSNFQLVYANKSYFNLMNEITGKDKALFESAFVDVFGEKDAEKWKTYYERALEGESFEVEGQFFNPKSNEIKYSQTSFEPIWNDLEIIAVNCQSRDITEKIPQNEKVIQRQKRFESLIENGLDCVLVLTAEGKPMYVSSSIESVLGYTPDETMEMNIWDLCHPDDLSGAEIALKRSIESPGVPIPGHISRAKHKNGSWRWIEPVITNLLHDPAVMGIVDNFRDITDKIEEQRRLNLFKSVLSHAKDAIFITEINTEKENQNKIIYVNESFTKMTGYSLEDVLGKSPELLNGPNSIKEELIRLERAIQNTESCEITTINYKKSGEEFWVNLNITPVANEFGKYTHWIAIERDVTERKFKEIEKEILIKINSIFLQNSNKSLSVYLTKLCKEVNNIGNFSFSEVWLPSIDNKTINRAANHATDKSGKSFYTKAPNINSFALDEKMSLQDWQNQTIEIWDESDFKWNIFERKVAAKKAGINTLIRIPVLDNEQVIGRLLLGSEKTKIDLQFYLRLFRKLGSTIGKELSRKKLEVELAQIFDFTPDMICVAGFDGYFKKINPAGLKIMGYSLEEMCSRPIHSFLHEDDKLKTVEKQQKLYRGENLKHFENRYITKQGGLVWLSWTARSSPEHGIIYAVAKNITEEKKLRELNREVRNISKIGSWEVDLINQSIFWSDEVHMIHETEPNSYLPSFETSIHFYKKEFQKLVYDNFEKCISTGQPIDFEAILVTSKKNEMWVRTYGYTEFIDGKCTRIYGSIQNIDASKKAQKEIRDSEERRRLIMSGALDAIICMDINQSITFWNPQAETIFKWKETEVIGEHLGNLIVPEQSRKFHNEGIRHFINTGEDKIFSKLLELTAIRKNGEEFPIELTVIPVKQGNDSFFCAFIRDISKRKKAEKNILLANERFEKVTQATRDMIWDWDIVKGTFYRSQAMEYFIGKETSRMYSLDQFLKEFAHSEDFVRILKSVATAISDPDRNHWEFEYRLNNSKGDVYFVIDRGIIIRNENKKAIRMVGAMTDVTKLKQMELQLSELNQSLQLRTKELERSNDELEQFAYIASHDLQEPLRMVSSFMDLLKKKYENQLDEKAHSYIYYASDGARRMRQIILDLLDYSRAGRIDKDLVPIDMNNILDEYKILRRKIIGDKNVVILSDPLPKVKCFNAPLTQTIHCLLDNAIKYADENVPPKIEIRLTENEKEWVFRVIDNGIGIDSRFFDKIFIIFQRLNKTEQYEGTGIGLSITKKNVESWNGKIWLESKINEGSTFYFTINKN